MSTQVFKTREDVDIGCHKYVCQLLDPGGKPVLSVYARGITASLTIHVNNYIVRPYGVVTFVENHQSKRYGLYYKTHRNKIKINMISYLAY